MKNIYLKRITTLCLALMAIWSLNAQTVVYSQDFEGTAPWGMTTVDNISSGNVWNSNTFFADPNYSGGTGACATASSDATCDGSAWDTYLLSPAIDLSGGTSASVSFKSNFQDFAGASDAEFAVSTDGINWTVLYAQTNDDPAIGANVVGNLVLTYDLTAYIGGNIFMRWRYDDDADGCAWYWQIDDVVVTTSTGGGGGGSNTIDFPTACGLNIAIPDASCPTTVLASTTVSGLAPLTGTTTLLSAEIIITHTWDEDLEVFLESPTGTIVELTTDNGGSGDNYGVNDGLCTQTTRFIMSASTPVTAGVAPFVGDYLPEGNLDNFNNGQDPNGVWNLRACDDDAILTGSIRYFNVTFNIPPPPPPYCIPTVSTPDEYISGFTLGTINNPVDNGYGANGYQDWTSLSTDVQAGVPTAYSAVVGPPFYNGDVTDVWVDLNNDNDFSDLGELVSTTVAVDGITGIANGSITLPVSTTLGTKRLRVAVRFNSSFLGDPAPNPCGPYVFGEFEDYTINVTAAPSCLAPNPVFSTFVGTSQAQLNWTLVSGAQSYDVQYRAVGDPNWITVGNFADPTSSTILNGLASQTAYEFQVQTRCSLTDTSGFSLVGLFSTGCFDVPQGAVAENEINGGDSNGGCNSLPEAYEPITPGVPVSGTGWSNTLRDTDWYTFTVGSASTVTVTLNSDFPAQLGVLDISTGCNNLVFVDNQTSPFGATCNTTVSTVNVCAGTYIVFVAPNEDGFPVGGLNNYNVLVDVQPATNLNANTNACGAIELTVGQSCNAQAFDNLSTLYCSGGGGSGLSPSCYFDVATQDVWFYLIAPASGNVSLDGIAGTITDGVMAAYTGVDCNNLVEVACDDDGGPGFLPALDLTGLTPGDTVWIQYFQFGGGTGTFELCAYDCDFVPGVGTPEIEACFGTDNDGCNNVFNFGTPATYQTLSCNETVIGTSYFDGFTRDTDWYEYTITSTTSVSWTVQADFSPQLFILNDDCNNIQLIAQATGAPCDVVTTTAVLGPGVYHFFVAPDFNNDLTTFDCTSGDGDYQATLNISVPDPSIGAPSDVCLADAPFNIIAANPGGTYASNGAGITDQFNGVFDPSAAGVGTWDIYYTIDVNGCIVADTISITIQDLPSVATAPTGNAALCFNPADETYTITSIAGADSYNWILTPTNAGTVSGTDTSVVVNFDDAFSGTASLVVAGVNECGTGAFSTSLDIVVTPLPGQAGTPAGPNSLCQGAVPTDYTSAGDPASTSYTWTIVTTPANGATISGTGSTGTVTWDPNFVGTADITVEGSNSCGDGTVSSTYTVTINATTPSSIDPVSVACAGGSIQLTASPAGGTFSGDDVDASGLFTPSNGAGTYTILYTPAGGCSSPSTLTLNVGDVPATPSVPLGISSQCQDGPNTTVFVIPVAGADSYTWSITPAGAFETAPPTSGTSVEVNWASDFFGDASFIVSATNGCGTSLFSQPLIIVINPNPVAQITTSGPYCVSDSCFQLAADLDGFWSSTCANSVTSDGIFCPSVAGACTVNLTVVENGCQGVATTSVNVQPAVVATITVPAIICEDDAPVTLAASPAGGSWSGDVNGSGVFTPSTPGTFSATYTVNNGGGCYGAATEDIDVNGLPVASFSYTAQCQALTFFNESAFSDGASFFWSFGDSPDQTSSAENTSHVYQTTGTVSVKLTVTNACGTSDTTVNVVVQKCVGVDENVVDQLNIFPNPTNGLVNVFFNSAKAQGYSLNVVDVTGKVLYTQNLTNFVGAYNNAIDFSRFASGMYIVRIIAEDGRATNVKVVRD